jgi:lysophospholipase L1-like esterase
MRPRTILATFLCAGGLAAQAASFAEFDRRARAGERLTVCFFGASLTWGANATDPNRTSYRALVGRRLEARYPSARFAFVDGAIGGTGSQLGIFRLERDVLRYRPALVFLDFTANDGIEWTTPDSMASYEAILRRILLEAEAPVVQMIFPFRWNVEPGRDIDAFGRRKAHIALSRAYGTGLGDAVALARERLSAGETTLARLWPFDGVHPSDEGYALFADAAWNAFEAAVAEGRTCTVPEAALHGDAYRHAARVPVAGDPARLPDGWTAARPSVQSPCHDMLMSRWLDSVALARIAPAAAVKPLTATFRGSSLYLFGESTPKSAKFRVWIDGQAVRRPDAKEDAADGDLFDAGALGRRMGGAVHLSQALAAGLDPDAEHTLRIEPVAPTGEAAAELRFGSLCVAGPTEAWLAVGPADER